MPYLDWVNKAQAVSSAADVPYHLLQFESAHGDASAENLLIQGDNLKALKALLPFYIFLSLSTPMDAAGRFYSTSS